MLIFNIRHTPELLIPTKSSCMLPKFRKPRFRIHGFRVIRSHACCPTSETGVHAPQLCRVPHGPNQYQSRHMQVLLELQLIQLLLLPVLLLLLLLQLLLLFMLLPLQQLLLLLCLYMRIYLLLGRSRHMHVCFLPSPLLCCKVPRFIYPFALHHAHLAV